MVTLSIWRCVAVVEYLPRVQPLISRFVYVDLNQRTTKMLIDESKMAADGSFSFLNRRKKHSNLKFKLLFMIETQTNSH